MFEPVVKRAIFYIGGYDPKSSDAFFERLEREATRYEDLVGATVSKTNNIRLHEDITQTRYAAKGQRKGKAWSTETDFHFLTLDDIVLKDFKRPLYKRFAISFITTWDYLLTGTAFKFCRHAWRFFAYFSYPPMAVVLTVVLAWLAARLMYLSPLPYSTILAAPTFLVSLLLLIQFFWKRWFVLHLMDLWSFSRGYLRRERPDIEAKLDRMAETVCEIGVFGDYDEILFVGHSTGGALILDVVARANEMNPYFHKRFKNANILTVGSTALKIGLHPAAEWYRARLRNLFQQTSMKWFEYQCLTDIINFYRTDPSLLMKLDIGHTPDGSNRLVTRTIRVKNMVSKEIYERIRRNFFRVHYQFVYGNTVPYHYDFMGICFGPASLSERVAPGFIEGQ